METTITAIIGKIKAIVDNFIALLTVENGFQLVGIILTLALIRAVYKGGIRALKHFEKHGNSPFDLRLFEKILKYIYWATTLLYVLWVLGVNLGTLIGAAGIAGVAISLAAQTSFSNIISGLFVLSDRSFKIDDVVQIDDISGTVETITMMSTKVRTFDNQLVRIPNETVLKSNLINFSDCKIRRFSMKIRLPFDCDLEKSENILLEAASSCEHALKEPAPAIYCDELGERHIKINLAVWAKRDEFWPMRNELFAAIAARCKSSELDVTFARFDIELQK